MTSDLGLLKQRSKPRHSVQHSCGHLVGENPHTDTYSCRTLALGATTVGEHAKIDLWAVSPWLSKLCLWGEEESTSTEA